MGSIYGYVRVSSREQNEDRQLIVLQEMDVPEHNIYMDKQSGKDFNRPAYKRMLQKLKPEMNDSNNFKDQELSKISDNS